MALLITKDLTVLGDMDLAQLYLRLGIEHGPSKTPLKVNVFPYTSKVAFNDSVSRNAFYVDGISSTYNFSYDASDGEVLPYVHTELKTLLGTDQTVNVPVIDPSTGLPATDPSTGEIIYEEIVQVPKFAEPGEITIVDLD